jgi:formylglycine-generating enzyme required for sulfatase activity
MFSGGASPFGVEDVVGNVLEWMESRVGDRDVGVTLSTRGNVRPQEFVRGGAFYKSGDEARLGYRFFPLDPSRRDRYLGFRIGLFASSSVELPSGE